MSVHRDMSVESSRFYTDKENVVYVLPNGIIYFSSIISLCVMALNAGLPVHHLVLLEGFQLNSAKALLLFLSDPLSFFFLTLIFVTVCCRTRRPYVRYQLTL